MTKPAKKDNGRKKLTIKQAKFTKEYLKTGNGVQAIKKAYGIKDSNTAGVMAHENLRKPNIQEAVQDAAAKLGINPEYVLGGIKEVFDFNKEKRVKAKRVGEEIFHEEEMIDAQASLKAGDLLGKHLKLFSDKIEVEAKVEVSEDPDQKLKLAKKIAHILQSAPIVSK